MSFDSELRRHERVSAEEPVAIVGIAALYPGARGPDDYWQLLNEVSSSESAPPSTAGGLEDIKVDVARFGIPPAQAGSMARMQLLMLEAARQCLSDAGHPERPLSAEHTDVITGTCFGLDRQYANALRIEGSRYAREVEAAAAAAGADTDSARLAAEEFRTLLGQRLGASPHDRVGEMASTIPARIATAFKFHGRTFAVESADATSFVGIAQAVGNLRAGLSDAALVVAGQRREGPFLEKALLAKGLGARAASPFAVDGRGYAIGEGVGALLLKRVSTAVRDGDRIYATILDCSLRHDARPGAFRSSSSVDLRRSAASESLRASAVTASSTQYVECVGSGIAHEVQAELTALAGLHEGGAPGSVAIGSVKDRLGHTFANAGVAAVTKVALALHHRRIPPRRASADAAEHELDGTPFRFPDVGETWQPAGEGLPRRAVVHGASLTGTLCHFVLEEHDPGVTESSTRPGARAARGAGPEAKAAAEADVRYLDGVTESRAEPIAVVGLAGRFAGSPDAESLWRVVRSGESQIGPVPEAVLDRDLYYAPGALSLTHSYTDQGAHVVVPDQPPPGLGIVPQRYAAMDAAQRLTLDVAAQLFEGRIPAVRPQGTAPESAGTGAALTGRGLVAVGSNLGLTRERRANTELCLQELEEAVVGLPALAHLSPLGKKTLLTLVRERSGALDEAMSPALLDGCLASGVAALLANEYRLDAVPLAVEAACASSLAALDVAVGALRSGTADFAIAGGVELACNTRDMVLCSALGLLSHSRNAPFDAGADGFTPGDGCGLFLLKRRSDALRDGDNILGLVRGVGASNDAKSLIAPDVAGQARAMERAFAQVDFAPSAVDYLEAHGTGTKVGDRVEIAAAAQVYASADRVRPLEIGSAKSFFGHTFAAAGSAGLLRTLLALRARTLPPNTNLHTLNPALDLAAIPASISTEPSPWTTPPGRPRRAGVSSFGTGGINYHVLLEEHMDGTR
ncbi:polyketide synthase [Streptomyces sp. NBC_00878]|uniref:beta-ketoacyl [acyl carrier protein] synthase domain-containing protein n=1 Tax=Streptomyces sp. NBC_00878 TaxID=2975854 RepID=UPI00225BC8AD|nr:polyketide synthase [Streptomyces sp. NBC_00878]MCX4911595.1 polyketide synthase [Streptomyces sp. NBC_00878]